MAGDTINQNHWGSGHNIGKVENFNFGSQYLQANDALFEYLATHLRARGIKKLDIKVRSDNNSLRISDLAKAYFSKAGFDIVGDIVITFSGKPFPAPYFINEREIVGDRAPVYFDGGTPLDHFQR